MSGDPAPLTTTCVMGHNAGCRRCGTRLDGLYELILDWECSAEDGSPDRDTLHYCATKLRTALGMTTHREIVTPPDHP
jgi:hypothetical protein